MKCNDLIVNYNFYRIIIDEGSEEFNKEEIYQGTRINELIRSK